MPIVQGLGGHGKGKKWQGGPMPLGPGGKKGKKGKGQPGSGEGVQVNLIVDPAMFGVNRPRRGDEDEDEDEEGELNRKEGSRPRRSVFEAVAIEKDWNYARKQIKWYLFADATFALIWFAEFFFVLWGTRCSPGTFDGWCDAFNVATACGFLLGVTFCLGVYFDIRDLTLSKQSPRSRV